MPPLTIPVFADGRLGDVKDNIKTFQRDLKHLEDLDFADDIALHSIGIRIWKRKQQYLNNRVEKYVSGETKQRQRP